MRTRCLLNVVTVTAVAMSDRYAVVVVVSGVARQFTIGGQLAAQCVCDFWLLEGYATEAWWQLRDDLDHPRPVLVMLRLPGSRVLHAVALVPGKPVTCHPETLCRQSLDWERVAVMSEYHDAPRCPGCLHGLWEIV